MAGKRSTTGALREPPGLGFGRLLGDGARRLLILLLTPGRVQEEQQPVALAVKVVADGVPDGCAIAERDPARILGDAVDPELIVEVRPTGQPGRPDVADRLALPDPCACPNPAREAPQVAVARRDPVPVPELDQVAVSSRSAGTEHHAVACGHHRCAGCGGVVGALVPAGNPEDWMEASTREAG